MSSADQNGLRAEFRGELIQPGDPDYESARRVYNGMIDRRPALIARCCDAADVIAGIDPGPARAGDITSWARDYWQALHPHSAGGAYVNFMME
jgi:hypothetical protein